MKASSARFRLWGGPIAVLLVLILGPAWVPNTAADDPVPEINITDAPTLGPASAALTIIEFADFECPYCAKGARAIRKLMNANPGQVRWVFKHYPMRRGKGGVTIHEAALAAHEQGKFWEMHELLLDNQGHLSRSELPEYARRLNLDMDAFTAALDSHRYRRRVLDDVEEGSGLRLTGTPTYFVNGKRIIGARPFGEWRAFLARPDAAPAAPSPAPGN